MVLLSVDDAVQLCCKSMVQQSEEMGGTICMQSTAWQRLQGCVPPLRCHSLPELLPAAVLDKIYAAEHAGICEHQLPAARAGAAAGSRPLGPHALHTSQIQPLCTQLHLRLALIVSAGRGNTSCIPTDLPQQGCCQQQAHHVGTGHQRAACAAQTTKASQLQVGHGVTVIMSAGKGTACMHKAIPASNAAARLFLYAWHRQPALGAACTSWGRQAAARTDAGSSPQQDCHQLQPLPRAQAASAAGSAVGARSLRTLR